MSYSSNWVLRFVPAFAAVVLSSLCHANGVQADYLSTLQGLGGLISHWGMEETNGTVVADLVTGDSVDGDNPGSINSGQGASLNVAGPRPSDGFFGFSSSNSAVDFNGSGGTTDPTSQRLMMDPTGYTGVSGLTEVTMAMWFRITDTSTTKHYHLGGLQKSSGSGRYSMVMNYYGSSNASNRGLRAFSSSAEPVDLNETGFSTDYGLHYLDSTWHLAVATFEQDGANKILKLYVDGNLEKSDTDVSGALDRLSIVDSLVFGQDADVDNGRLMVGQLDEIAFFDHALNSTEVSSLYNSALGESALTLTVDRFTGAITLSNDVVPANIRGYSITSASGSLDPSAWIPIAGHYDVDGNGSVDSDDAWTILTDTNESVTYEDLSEFQFDGTPGNGGIIGVGQDVVLSAGGAWLPTSNEDLVMTVTFADGNMTEVNVEYTGDGGAPGGKLWDADLDHDGDVDVEDWKILRDNTLTDVSDLTEAQRHVLGDLTDIAGASTEAKINIRDFSLFMKNYQEANPGASFAEMLQSVPEPSSLMLLGLGLGLAVFGRRGRRAASKSTARLAALVLVITGCGIVLQPETASADAYSETLLSIPDLEHYWRLSESNGSSTTTDDVGGKTGSYMFDSGGSPSAAASNQVAGPRPSDGFYGFGSTNVASGFPGTNNDGNLSIEMADPDDLGSSRQFSENEVSSLSMVLWFQSNDLGKTAELMGYTDSSGTGRYRFMMEHHSSGLRVRVKTSDQVDPTDSTVTGTIDLSDNGWHMLTATWNGESDTLSLYLDDGVGGSNKELAVSTISPDSTSYIADADYLTVGRDVTPNGREFDGSIDEIAIFSRALSPSEVTNLYSSAIAETLTALIQPVTGEIRLRNDSGVAIAFNSYQIETKVGTGPATLNYAGWNSLEDQGIDALGAGEGQHWSEVGGSNSTAVSEQYFEGNTTLAPGEEISLGTLYNTSVAGQISLRIVDAVSLDYFNGLELTQLLGDMNDDGLVNEADVPLFVQALTNRAAYESVYSTLDADFIADFDGNGLLDFGDINEFSLAVNAASASGSATAVPEPATYLLLTFGLIFLWQRCLLASRHEVD